jgi:uncharacterized protein with NRDE domain
MCLILLAHDLHPRYRLILAANRDEYFDRPSAAADWWPDHPGVLAGRDLQGGGTWMGVTRTGRWSAITNFREPDKIAEAPSRGGLVLAALTSGHGPDRFLRGVQAEAVAYNGFNQLVGDDRSLWYYSNRGSDPPRQLDRGLYGLSNHLLDTSWPKVEGGKRELANALDLEGEALVEQLLELLGDRSVPPDDDLPDTGVGLDFERILAPRFIVSPVYGTRTSYVLLIDRNGEVVLVEQQLDKGRPRGRSVRFVLQIEGQ